MTQDEAKWMSHVERRELLRLLREQLKLVYGQIGLLESTCPHSVAEIPGDYYAEDKWRSDGASCEGCGRDMGWYCPKSPDHFCHYDGTDGEPGSEYCDYCRMPDERK
jgi:hypothetical protein